MGYVTCCAFWFSTISVSFMVFAFLAPFWLGRLDLGIAYYFGLWYNLECFEHDCTLYSDTFDSETVPLVSRSWSMKLVALPVFATIGLVFGFLALLILEIVKCWMGRRSANRWYYRTKAVIVFCTVLLIISGIANFIACIVGIYAASEYYKDNAINHAAEFPWCLLSLIIATILVFLGVVLYLIIICRWEKYADHYDFRRWSSKQNLQNGQSGYYKSSDSRHGGGSNFRETNKTSAYSSSIPAFSYPPLALSNSVGMSSSLVGKGSENALSKRYGQDKMRRVESENGISRRSMHERPTFLKEKSYIREHDEYLDRLRASRSQSEFRTRRDDHYSGYSVPRSEPGIRGTSKEPSVLDILYRESRKDSTHL